MQRIELLLPEVADFGSQFKPRKQLAAFAAPVQRKLRQVIRESARQVLVQGAAGSGKTAVLSFLVHHVRQEAVYCNLDQLGDLLVAYRAQFERAIFGRRRLLVDDVRRATLSSVTSTALRRTVQHALDYRHRVLWLATADEDLSQLAAAIGLASTKLDSFSRILL